MKFKVGDRVMATGYVDGINLSGKTGTVVQLRQSPSMWAVGVEFDEPIGGHDCRGSGKDGYCRYGSESEFENIDDSLSIQIEEIFW